MDIKTKYNIGDVVWATIFGRSKDAPVHVKIVEIRINMLGEILYQIEGDANYYEEKRLYETREEAFKAHAEGLVICLENKMKNKLGTLHYYKRLVNEMQTELGDLERAIQSCRAAIKIPVYCGNCVNFEDECHGCHHFSDIHTYSNACGCRFYATEETQ